MKDNNQWQDVRWSAVILLGLAVALIGVRFIVSAPLDADARTVLALVCSPVSSWVVHSPLSSTRWSGGAGSKRARRRSVSAGT